jgi:hypothetical protein
MAREYSEDYLFNHVMRTWLFGALVISHNTTLQQTVDLEVHAIGAILHVSNNPILTLSVSPLAKSHRVLFQSLPIPKTNKEEFHILLVKHYRRSNY